MQVNLGDLSQHDKARVREIEKACAGEQTPYECVRRLRVIANAEQRAVKAEQAEIRRLGDALRQRHHRHKGASDVRS